MFGGGREIASRVQRSKSGFAEWWCGLCVRIIVVAIVAPRIFAV